MLKSYKLQKEQRYKVKKMNATKDIQVFYEENYKTILKDILKSKVNMVISHVCGFKNSIYYIH